MKTETSYREQMWIWETIHRLHQAAVKELFCSCRSLVDTVYSLKDEVQELKQVSLQFPRYMTNTDFSVLSRGEGQNQKAWCVLNSYEKLMISVDVKQSLLWYTVCGLNSSGKPNLSSPIWRSCLLLSVLSTQHISPLFCLFFSLLPFHFFLCLASSGQQEDEEDAGGGAASEERAGEDCQESFEEHERPDLGRDEPLRSGCVWSSIDL